MTEIEVTKYVDCIWNGYPTKNLRWEIINPLSLILMNLKKKVIIILTFVKQDIIIKRMEI